MGGEVVKRGLAVIVLLVAAAAVWIGYAKSRPLDTHREDIKSVEIQPNPEGPQVPSSRDSRTPMAIPSPSLSQRSPGSSPTRSLTPSGRASTASSEAT